MYKLDIDLEERKRQIEMMFNVGLIGPSTFHDMIQDIRNEEQVGVLEYNATDDEMSKYFD